MDSKIPASCFEVGEEVNSLILGKKRCSSPGAQKWSKLANGRPVMVESSHC
jgi:hypothetical protein